MQTFLAFPVAIYMPNPNARILQKRNIIQNVQAQDARFENMGPFSTQNKPQRMMNISWF